MIIVPDAGPLIYLGGAGHLELLRTLYAEVVVPRIVVDEIVIAGAGLTGAREVAAATWIRVEEVAPVLPSTENRGTRSSPTRGSAPGCMRMVRRDQVSAGGFLSRRDLPRAVAST